MPENFLPKSPFFFSSVGDVGVASDELLLLVFSPVPGVSGTLLLSDDASDWLLALLLREK